MSVLLQIYRFSVSITSRNQNDRYRGSTVIMHHSNWTCIQNGKTSVTYKTKWINTLFAKDGIMVQLKCGKNKIPKNFSFIYSGIWSTVSNTLYKCVKVVCFILQPKQSTVRLNTRINPTAHQRSRSMNYICGLSLQNILSFYSSYLLPVCYKCLNNLLQFSWKVTWYRTHILVLNANLKKLIIHKELFPPYILQSYIFIIAMFTH